ncbi:MAG: hypothetical protein JRJ19_03010 [Deltaproteobacteria bacterium]|nr:hypothetical protein [Deltaproteobacteria bacterium]
MKLKLTSRLIGLSLCLLGLSINMGCSDKYERLPKATTKEVESLTERFQAFLDEAKKIKPDDSLALLHHFSHAALTAVSPGDFKTMAAKFISSAGSGGLDDLEIKGARSPGKVRVLLIKTSEGKGVIPFVQSSDGWKMDEIKPAFGDFSTEVNLKGNMPVSPPSILASVSVLQDPQSSETDRVQAALGLSSAKDQETCKKFAATEKKAWPKTALLYAAWKTGGNCAPFAAAFPEDGEAQVELYDADTESYRTLLKGLGECAAESPKMSAALKVYRGCYKVEGSARSEYVDMVVALANAKPAYILQAALKTKYKYETDPVANIVVGAIHGEKEAGFYKFIYAKAKSGGRAGRLAKDWVEKMDKRDEEEPAGTHDPEKAPAE